MKSKLTIIVVLLCASAYLFGQDVNSVSQTEQARQALGQTQKMAGEVVLGVGNTGIRFEEPEGSFKKVVDIWGKIGLDFQEQFKQQWNEDVRNEISNYLRAFLSNTPDFFVAELDQDRLNSIGEEFNLVELGGAEFTTEKQSGKWAGLDYLVRIDAVQGNHGERLIVADMINLESRETFTAMTAQVGNVINNLDIARRLTKNMVDVYQAKSAEERELIQKLQRSESRAMSVSKDTQYMLRIAGIGYTTSAVFGTIAGGFSGYVLGTIFAGGLSYVCWTGLRSTKKEYNNALDQYDDYIAQYNNQYGAKYVDYLR